MLNFKASVSSDWKKYNIIIKAESYDEAKDRLHKEGYSILSLQQTKEEIKIKGTKFLFEAIILNERKKWTIAWEDIFKAYLKLVDDLKYEVISFYPEEIKDNQDEIIKTTSRLEAQYEIYRKSQNHENRKEIKKQVEKDKKDNDKQDFYLQKKINESYDNLNLVLVKIDNLLDPKYKEDINDSRREKLIILKESIITIKNSTNLVKIKQISEKSLLKLWEIELSIYEKYKNLDFKKELNNTNKLLKKLWSRESFIEKDKDINYKLSQFKLKIENYFENKKLNKEIRKRNILDKSSNDYIKTILLIKKYEDKSKKIKKEILKKSLYPILWKNKKEEYEKLIIKSDVINQNIKLLNAKIKWVNYSYTKIKKWYSFIESLILKWLSVLNYSLYYAIILCILTFIFIIFSSYYFWSDLELSKYSILYFILLQILYIIIYMIRWIFSMIVNFAIFWIMVIFLLVNF